MPANADDYPDSTQKNNPERTRNGEAPRRDDDRWQKLSDVARRLCERIGGAA